MTTYAERNRAIAAAYASGGVTMTHLGRQHGICPARVRQIILREQRKMRFRIRKTAPFVLAPPGRVLDPDGDGLRDRWIEFQWARNS